jgi:hypothetical protein
LHWIAIAWIAVCGGYILFTVRALIRTGGRLALSRTMALVFLMSCLLASVYGVAAIIVGGSDVLAEFHDYLSAMRYLHPTFLLPLFGFPVLLGWVVTLACTGRACRMIATLVAVVAVLVPIYQIAISSSPRQAIYTYMPPLVQFMDELSQHESLRYGYAGYWQARPITLLSHRGLRAYAVNGVLSPLLWVSNREWYFQSVEKRTKPPHIDFVVLDDPLWKLTRENAVRVLGEPSREVRFENTRVLIYSRRSSLVQNNH